jgi:cation diffusion facilitator CzcD-associated flavoprotein CzcO
MSNSNDVAIIGAGPYGLSLAAHLRARGLRFRIFGRPLDTWRAHMPRNMLLKSEGFASSLSAPIAGHTLKNYCTDHGIAYADQGLPVPLDVFLAYAEAFQKRFAPRLENVDVRSVERAQDSYILTLGTGERVCARNVVLAVGISWFAHTPEILSALPAAFVSHSYQHRHGEAFKGREVTIIGAGASAIDLASLLQDCGASVRIVARKQSIRFHSPPDPDAQMFWHQLRRPPSGIGPGWRSFFCANAPQLFHRMPKRMRLRATQSHLGPAPGWFMRERVDGRIPTMLGYNLANASLRDGHVALALTHTSGKEETLICDHVIAATGYRPDLGRLPFFASSLRTRIKTVQHTPILSSNFETSERGLFVVGPAAANSFGPLMRFMVGAQFVAPRLAAHLERRVAALQVKHGARLFAGERASDGLPHGLSAQFDV